MINPDPDVLADAKANRSLADDLAIEKVIEKIFVHLKEDEIAAKKNKFMEELSDFQSQTGPLFSRAFIWNSPLIKEVWSGLGCWWLSMPTHTTHLSPLHHSPPHAPPRSSYRVKSLSGISFTLSSTLKSLVRLRAAMQARSLALVALSVLGVMRRVSCPRPGTR